MKIFKKYFSIGLLVAVAVASVFVPTAKADEFAFGATTGYLFNGDYNDAIGSIDLTAHGSPTFVTGLAGTQAVNFSGASTDYLDHGGLVDNVGVVAQKTYSVTTWVNMDANPSGGHSFQRLFYLNRVSGRDISIDYQLYSGDYYLRCRRNSGTGGNRGTDYNFGGTPPLTVGTFHMVSCVYNDSDYTMKLYLDNALIDTQTGSATVDNETGGTGSLFVSINDANALTGTEENLAFYDGVALSGTDISNLYADAGSGSSTPADVNIIVPTDDQNFSTDFNTWHVDFDYGSHTDNLSSSTPGKVRIYHGRTTSTMAIIDTKEAKSGSSALAFSTDFSIPKFNDDSQFPGDWYSQAFLYDSSTSTDVGVTLATSSIIHYVVGNVHAPPPPSDNPAGIEITRPSTATTTAFSNFQYRLTNTPATAYPYLYVLICFGSDQYHVENCSPDTSETTTLHKSRASFPNDGTPYYDGFLPTFGRLPLGPTTYARAYVYNNADQVVEPPASDIIGVSDTITFTVVAGAIDTTGDDVLAGSRHPAPPPGVWEVDCSAYSGSSIFSETAFDAITCFAKKTLYGTIGAIVTPHAPLENYFGSSIAIIKTRFPLVAFYGVTDAVKSAASSTSAQTLSVNVWGQSVTVLSPTTASTTLGATTTQQVFTAIKNIQWAAVGGMILLHVF